jgi:aubergine-like protein
MQGKEDETVLVCLVPELCYLTGLDDRLRNNFTIMRSLATHTKVAPMARAKALTNYIESVNSKLFRRKKFYFCCLTELL